MMKRGFWQKIGNEEDENIFIQNQLFQEAKTKNEVLDYNGAILDLNRAINNFPEGASNAEIYLFRGKIKLNQFKSYKEALADLDAAVRLKPKVAEAYRVRGDIKKEIRDFKGALRDLNYGISQLYKERADTLEYLGYEEEAIQDRNRAEELSAS